MTKIDLTKIDLTFSLPCEPPDDVRAAMEAPFRADFERYPEELEVFEDAHHPGRYDVDLCSCDCASCPAARFCDYGAPTLARLAKEAAGARREDAEAFRAELRRERRLEDRDELEAGRRVDPAEEIGF